MASSTLHSAPVLGKIPALQQIGTRLLGFVFASIFLVILIEAALNLSAAQESVDNDSRQSLTLLANDFVDESDTLSGAGLALATSIAERPDVQDLLLAQNRDAMTDLLRPMFETLRERYDLTHLYIHTADGFVFLRVHQPDQYGDTFLPYRRTIQQVVATQEPSAGIELDPNLLGLRAVVPMERFGRMIGMVEVGIDFGDAFVADLRARNEADYTFWLSYDAAAPTGYWPTGEAANGPTRDLFFYRSTLTERLPIPAQAYEAVLATGTEQFVNADAESNFRAAVLAPLQDSSGRTIGVVEIARSLEAQVTRLANAQATTLLIAFGLLIGTLTLLGLLINRTIIRPVHALAVAAQRQNDGDLTARVPVRGRDEFAQLGTTFNSLSQKLGETLDQQRQSIVDKERLIRQLKETSRYKDEFLAVMSHELRTPLNAMIGLLGIVTMTRQLDEQTRNLIGRARANSERLLSLINNILDISRMEAGRLEIVPSEVDIRKIVGKFEEDMSVLATQKNLAFTVDIAEDVPDVILTDEDALNKILVNLLGNAFKFTQQGRVTLDIKRLGEKLEIRVQDTGIGIPPQMRDVIFESFRQADGSSTRQYGGTGLGLSIVKNLCVAMGGTIRLQSEVGIGSTFIVHLPVHTAPMRLDEAETNHDAVPVV